MPYTVTNLIADAFYDSGVVAREFEELQGYQLNDGLLWLNQILGDKAVDNGDIPYITVQYPLTLVVGQEEYFIPGLVDIQAITFNIGSVRYQMDYVDRVRYFGQPRADNINSLPLSYTYERQLGGTRIWVYFSPQEAYVANITGNFFLQNVSLNQDLSTPITTVNLGGATIYGGGVLAAGELVVNGVDLAGTYTTPGALASYINGNVPFVGANYVNFQFNLISSTGVGIAIATQGTVTTSNGITFRNFSTINGPYNASYYAAAFDQFYIDYLEFSLAERICRKSGFATPEGVANGLAEYKLQINKMIEPVDLTMQKISCLGNQSVVNYAYANLGAGYTVGR